MHDLVTFEQMIENIKTLATYKPSLPDAYSAGFNAGNHGVNEINTHFSFFGSPELSKQWNMGMKDGKELHTANPR